jgi:flagellar biosynthetic protein FlhB
MMQNVPGSDVVLRNPTHFAVALKYFPKHFLAPVVVAKGKDYKALKIIEIAENSGVTVHEDRPLARMLYETVAIGTMIPIELYSAIAVVYTEILHVSDMDMEESVETQNKLARDVILP